MTRVAVELARLELELACLELGVIASHYNARQQERQKRRRIEDELQRNVTVRPAKRPPLP
eukprot:COSAG05_NODE_9548_length_616_cov_1.584139_1_plen_60_part_00